MAARNLPQLLTPAETAELLGVTTGTLNVWRCVGRYRLPFAKIGRRVMYDASDVLEFIARRTVTTTGEARAVAD